MIFYGIPKSSFSLSRKIAGPACGNGGPHNPAWIKTFLSEGGAELLDVATYHYYGVKSTDKNLPADVVTTKFMDTEVRHDEFIPIGDFTFI